MVLEHVGILQSDDIPEESLLGYLVGIVHHRFTIDQPTMDGWLEQSKLPEAYRPHRPKAVKSFQMACRSLEAPRFREVVFRDPGTMLDIKFNVEYMVDSLSDGSRQLTRKIHYLGNENASKAIEKILDIYVNTTQKEPEKMMKVSFDQETEEITCTYLFDNPDALNIREMADEQLQKVREEYALLQSSYTERYLKDAWYRLLQSEGSIPWLRNCGSLWFVPKDAKGYVQEFGDLYMKVHNGSGTWRTVPIVNTEQHQKYLREDVMSEYTERYKSFLNDVAYRMESCQDVEALKRSVLTKKGNFEEKLKDELVSRYNSLLDMTLSVDSNDIKLEDSFFESSRLKKARELLAGL